MKWNSLGYGLRDRLFSEYNKRHADAIPTEPEWVQPVPAQRTVVNVNRKVDVYVDMKVADDRSFRGRAVDEAQCLLKVVGRTEHIDIELDTDRIPALIEQLKVLLADALAHDHMAKEYNEARQAYKDAMQAYKEKREADLEAALESGKFTEKQIADAPEDIPF